MQEIDLHLEPNEASDLCPALDAEALAARGWDAALATVLDEASAERALAILGHAAGAAPDAGWKAVRVPCKPSAGKGKTEDAESCARRDGWIYMLGSQFGKKAGPLSPRRSWIARVREDSIAATLAGERSTAELEVVRLRFTLHRAINDALLASGIELIERGPQTRGAYVDATIERGAAKGKRWAGMVTADDHPINVEGAEFRADGSLLCGLRYPVTAAGEPLLVELEAPAAVFEAAEPEPLCRNVWVLDGAGSREEPRGVRALHGGGDDRFEAVLGNLDSAGKGATILADHPAGARATSLHVSFELPLQAGGGRVASAAVHDFGDQLERVEGVAAGRDGHTYYVIDADGRVALRSLVRA